jgi:TM2 domain-containing membrane protein YozV
MNCAIHSNVPAAAFCRTCGKALCETCKRDVKGVIYCEDCIAAHVYGVAAAQPVPATTPVQSAPSPGLAAMLALIPGVGAMYNGQFKKGIAHVIAFAILVGMASVVGPVMVPFFFFYFFYLIMDAYKTARAKELGQPLPDPFGMSRFWGIEEEGGSWTGTGIPVGAVVLIGLGCLFLLHNLGFHFLDRISDLWPLILVGIGIYSFAMRQPACKCVRCQCGVLMFPSILITLGILLLLNSFDVKGFESTWPLLLIVIGVVKILQTSGPTTGHVDDVNVMTGAQNPENQGVPNA